MSKRISREPEALKPIHPHDCPQCSFLLSIGDLDLHHHMGHHGWEIVGHAGGFSEVWGELCALEILIR
jgi:hypothetical protein